MVKINILLTSITQLSHIKKSDNRLKINNNTNINTILDKIIISISSFKFNLKNSFKSFNFD